MNQDTPTDEPYRIELTPPNLEAYHSGNCGIPYVVSHKAEQPGPHVLLTALVHGNEYACAVALDRLLRLGLLPKRGRLTICFANIEAFLTFDASRPVAARKLDRDFNRLWATDVLDGPEQDRELRRARQLRPLVDTVDFLLDLHSLRQISAPLILCGRHEKGRRLAEKVGFPSWVVSDFGHAEGHRLRDYAEFDDPNSSRTALLVECGQHWLSGTAELAFDTALRFLRVLRAIDPDFASDRAPLPTGPQHHVQVSSAYTISTDSFKFILPLKGFEVIPNAGTTIAIDGVTEVRTPWNRCVIVMPSPNRNRGTTAVRFGQLLNPARDSEA